MSPRRRPPDEAPADPSRTWCRTRLRQTRHTRGVRRVCAGLGAVAALAAAGCGGAAKPAAAPAAPKLPRALAQGWAQQADAIAASAAAGDGCTAESRAVALRAQVVAAVNAHRIAQRYLETLVAAVNDIPARIVCAPPSVPRPGHAKGKDHGKGKGKGGQGGNGDGGN